ncbi:MAG: (2Fe-2S)-binding protein [Spirochaetaceae bacterium]|nr:MAG: (2Fe-2S)-binding protein [Spirochaetaceae bacterium]
MRIQLHPILGDAPQRKTVTINVDGTHVSAYEGEMIASALMAAGIKRLRTTTKHGHSRGVFCAIGRCTDCVMEVDGRPNVRTCVTPVQHGMNVRSQQGLGSWHEVQGEN